MLKIRFLGAAETVTGSKYSVSYGKHRLMVDCGMFQGSPELSRHNWDDFPEQAHDYEALVLTHAHIDHSGNIPRLVGLGFQGPILCTHPTRELCELLLPDSARIQEDDADYEHPPLYTMDDVEDSLDQMVSYNYGEWAKVCAGVRVRFHEAGHIVGSAWLEMTFQPLPEWAEQRSVTVVFSGDVGRGNAPILRDPERPGEADFLILESTYGNRLHSPVPARVRLAEVIRETIQQRAMLIIPAFAVQRCQDLAFLVEELRETREVGPVSLFVDSPMAARATRVFERYPRLLNEKVRRRGGKLLRYPYLRICENGEQSRSINDFQPPVVIIAASGMAAGGRVLHHLKRHLPDRRARVLLAGYQCQGTRGYDLQQGATQVEIHGQTIPVRARVESLHGLSGHADYAEIGEWLSELQHPPQRTFLVHGDLDALECQRARLSAQPGWDVVVPHHREEFRLR